MSANATLTRRGRFLLWSAVATGLLLVGAANWHLVYVAVTSQPDCVAHLRVGDGDAARGAFSAAKSACSQ